MSFELRRYQDADEQAWLRCRALGFLVTAFSLKTESLRPVPAFAHYTGDARDEIRVRFQRVHDDVLFERAL